ncbi:hypothetical protein [Flavobacterium sp. 3HN19-14]|uniref:hypothetical protein n=1 Tax=Flavobacterium sp. 3HN19-14 TaxID=3448133 RepID=UPI003EE1F75F
MTTVPGIGRFAFKTDCVAIADFFEDFDNDPLYSTPGCWTAFKRGPSVSEYSQVRSIDWEQVHSAPYTLQLFNDDSSTTDNDIMLVSPNLSTVGAGTHRVKF